jgi:ABC-type sugar transport system substrate-binding protein
MVFRKLAVAAALAAAATPAAALDPGEQALTMFYISIPLDFSLPKKERDWSAGLLLQGKRDYPGVRIDTTMLNAFSLNDIDAKWMVGGLVALGAIAAVSYKNKKTANELQQQQQAQQQATGGSPAAPCPRPPSDPCKK